MSDSSGLPDAPDQDVSVRIRTFADGTLALIFSVHDQDGERTGFWLGMDREAAEDLLGRLVCALQEQDDAEEAEEVSLPWPEVKRKLGLN
jgi:hypothetical protein